MPGAEARNLGSGSTVLTHTSFPTRKKQTKLHFVADQTEQLMCYSLFVERNYSVTLAYFFFLI